MGAVRGERPASVADAKAQFLRVLEADFESAMEVLRATPEEQFRNDAVIQTYAGERPVTRVLSAPLVHTEDHQGQVGPLERQLN